MRGEDMRPRIPLTCGLLLPAGVLFVAWMSFGSISIR
jgi:hypothetical protein